MSRRSKKFQKENKAGQQLPAITRDTEVITMQDTPFTLIKEVPPVEEILSPTTTDAEVNTVPTTNQEVSPMPATATATEETPRPAAKPITASIVKHIEEEEELSDICDPFGSNQAADYLYDGDLGQAEDWDDDPLCPGRLKVTSDFGKNLLKFAHIRVEEDAHRLKGYEDAFERWRRCNREGCLACLASVRGAQKVTIEFFYDLDDRRFIGYAAPSSNRRDSFGAKLRKALAGQIPSVLKVFRSENGGYLFKRNDSHTFKIEELGQKVLAFRKALENGEVDLEEILPEMDNYEMINIPAISNNLPVEYRQ